MQPTGGAARLRLLGRLLKLCRGLPMLSAKAHDSENLTHKKQSKKHTARLHEQRVVYDPA
jgi:hypothetical protein